MSNSQTKRDQRIDLLRGIALLILVTDHLPANPLRKFMPVSLGLADMAEAFVLLSGVAAAYGIMQKRTIRRCTSRRLQRAAVIYLSYVTTATLLVFLVRYFRIGNVAETLPAHLLSGTWTELISQIAMLKGRVSHLCILLLYVWLTIGLLFLPNSFWRRSDLIWTGSLLIYLGAQFFPVFCLPEPLRSTTYYNPFAWQFLFVTAVVCGITPDSLPLRFLKHPLAFPISLFVQGGLILSVGLELDFNNFLTSKTNLGLLRYLHAVSAAIILAAVLPKTFPSKWAIFWSPVLRCSRQSLLVYCMGSLLVVALSQALTTTNNSAIIIGVNLLAWIGCLGIARVAEKIKSTASRRREEVH